MEAALAQAIKHPHLIILNLMTLGMGQRLLGQVKAALGTQQQAIAIQEEAAARIFADWSLAELSALYALQGEWALAHAFARRAIPAREEETALPITLTSHYEITALLRGGDSALAQTEVQRLGQLCGDNPRYQLLHLHSLAVLVEWEERQADASGHWQEVLTLAETIGLPAEEREIRDRLLKLGP